MPYSVDDFKTRNMKLAGPIQPTYIDNGEGSTNSTLTTAETQQAIRDSDGGIMGSIKSVLDAAATKFTFGTTDRTEVAQQIGKNLNVNPDALMDLDQAGWNNVLMLNSQRSKVSDINDMYDNYPELRDIQYKSRAEATQLLQNMADAKKTRGLWDAVQQGIWSMNDQMKLADAAYQLANNQDEGKVDDLKNEISRLQENLKSYRTLGSNMTESIFEDTASQAYMMGKQAVVGTAKRAGQGMALGMGIGAAGGALAGGIGAAPGAVAGALTGLSYGVQTGMAEQMQHMSFGLKYLDLINKKDKNGNRIYTDQEARDRALAFSVVDTAIEFVAMKGAGKAIKGATPAASTLGKLMASRGAAETFQQGALATMENFVKTSVKAGSLELAEEGLQDINDKVQTNLWGKPGDTHYSVGDILTGSVQAMVDAAPAVLGLGILGGLGGGVRTASAFRQFNRLTPEMKNAVVQTEINTRGAQVLNAVIEDSKTNGLAKKNPELYAKVIQAQADKNGMSTVYINANDMVDTEEGQAVLQDLVNKGVVEQEAITKSIENDVPVEVPISSFAQMEEDITPENMKVLENNVHFTDGGMSMHAIEKAINTARTMQENFSSRSAAQREAVKGDILKEFDDTSYNDLQRQMAEQVIGTDPYRIKSNFNELYNRLDEEYREAYADDFKTLDFDQQSAEKPQWYADYVSENKRAPGAKARRRLAFEVAKERVNREYGTTATEEGKQIINDHYNEMEQKLNELEALDSIKDRMFAIADSDVHVRSSLSKEGFEVYNELSDLLKTGNLATAQQAKEAALLWAAHADVYADIVRSTGLRDYTAKDYMQQIEFEMNAQNAEEHNFSMHQFAGQSANNAPLEQLQTAKEMEANGKTSKDIWEATGWKKGSDDKWRFEIPDNLSGIDLDMLKVNKDTEVRLGEVYQNDRLYEAYPALKNIMVEARDLKRAQGQSMFDDTAVDIIREYNQSANQKRINGMTSFIGTDGQKLVQLFETANHSTFMHEAGHVFLEDLRMLANMPGIQEANEQVVKDWETIKEWTGYVEGADADTNRKAHEKFARGFEAYLREGKAPSKPLERAFRRFKDWLTALYENVLRVGGLPPKAVRDVMDRMLATKEAIDNYAAEQALEGFADSSFYKEMTDEDKTAYDKRLREIKDAAYETVHKEFLKEFEENAAKIDEQAVRDEVEQRLLEQYPIYKLSKNVEAIGDSVLAFSDYTSETLKKAENEEGMGPWPAVLDAETNRAIQAIKDNLSNPAYMASKAEEAFNSHEWQQRLAMEEAALIKKYANKAIARNYNLIAELSAINPDAPDAEERIAAVQKQINTKKDEKKNGPKQEDPAANRKVIDALKSELQSYIGNMRAMRNLSIGTVDDMMERAHRSLEDLSLSQATSFKHFQNKSITAARQADIAMAKGQMDEAFRQKQQQLLYQAMARAAYDNVEEVQSIEKDLKQKSVAMARPKNPVRIKGEARYFIQHLLYNMGLTSRDGIEPREGFTIESVMALLDPDAAILDEPSRVVFDQWVIDTFRDGKSWRQLTLSEFKQLAEIIRAVYTQGRSSYEGVSIINMDGEKISFDTAAQEMIEEGALKQSVEDPLNEKNKKGLRDAIADTANSYLSSLLKIETILRRYDGQKVGTWQRYIYEPIDRATRKGKKMLEKATKTLQANVNRYTKKELYTIRTEKRYAVGTIRNLTKENVIALALNWGTAANRQRVVETVGSNEVNIEADFARILTDKDWDFIEGVWAQINSYYDERSAVQERMYGSPMRKEKGVNFTINGRKINGQYYPIVYDSTLDGNAKDYEVEDIIKSQMSSNAVWGMGMSATKERSRVVKGKKLMLSFDVIPRAVDEAINHIAMREAATDVNRLLNNRDLAEYISRTMGVDTLQLMKTWVRDNWQAEITRMSKWDRAVNTFKANTSMAIMAYRTSTAVLNVLNVIPAAKEIGRLNMLWALKSFYGGLAKNREFVKEHSVFMRERLQNLDNDLNKGLAVGSSGILYKEGTKAEKLSKAKRKADDAKEWVNRYAYQFITETDLMISMPVWKFAYERKVEAMLNEGITDAARIEEEAVTEADRTVRRVFGSGETKDTAAIQRNRNSIVSLFTPFYTYSNTVLNALVEAGYAVKDNRDYGMLFNTVLHWIVIQGLCEAIIRSLWDGDDDDWTTILPKAATSMFSTTLSGLPFIRDAAGLALDAILGKPAMSKGNETVALSIMPKMLDTVRAMKNEKKSWIDVMRSGNQVVNRMTGFSDTLTDGFWTLTKWSLMKTDATIQDLIAAIIFDRNIKSKKEKHK